MPSSSIKKDSVIKRLTLPLTAGVAWGDFNLLRSYKPGGYHLRAYTNWMRNAGTDYFYNQRIQVGGLQPSLTEAKALRRSSKPLMYSFSPKAVSWSTAYAPG